MLHLGNAGQLGLQPLFLLSEGKARRCVQLLEAPASLAVELQQVGVVLPGSGKAHSESTSFDLMTKVSRLSWHVLPCSEIAPTTGKVCA